MQQSDIMQKRHNIHRAILSFQSRVVDIKNHALRPPSKTSFAKIQDLMIIKKKYEERESQAKITVHLKEQSFE